MQEEQYIAVISERLSKPGNTRYIIIDRESRQVMDDGMGHGYKSPQSAHKSFAFKQRRRQQRERARQMKQQYRAGGSQPSAPARRRSRQSGQPSAPDSRRPLQTEPSLPFASQVSRPADLVSPFVKDDMA